MGEVEAGIAAVVCLHVLQHHIREIQVPVMALRDTLVLADGLHGYKEAGVQAEVSSNDNSNKNHQVLVIEYLLRARLGPGAPQYLIEYCQPGGRDYSHFRAKKAEDLTRAGLQKQ